MESQQPSSPVDTLGKLPKNTPTWAVGVVAIIVSLGTSFMVLYLTAHSDISKIVEGHVSDKSAKVTAENNERDKSISSIIALVSSNSEQLTSLAKALAEAQTQGRSLSERISAIEKELAVARASLEACENKLSKCL